MGNKQNVQPQDFLHLYFDDYITDSDDENISDEEIENIRKQIEEENKARSEGK